MWFVLFSIAFCQAYDQDSSFLYISPIQLPPEAQTSSFRKAFSYAMTLWTKPATSVSAPLTVLTAEQYENSFLALSFDPEGKVWAQIKLEKNSWSLTGTLGNNSEAWQLLGVGVTNSPQGSRIEMCTVCGTIACSATSNWEEVAKIDESDVKVWLKNRDDRRVEEKAATVDNIQVILHGDMDEHILKKIIREKIGKEVSLLPCGDIFIGFMQQTETSRQTFTIESTHETQMIGFSLEGLIRFSEKMREKVLQITLQMTTAAIWITLEVDSNTKLQFCVDSNDEEKRICLDPFDARFGEEGHIDIEFCIDKQKLFVQFCVEYSSQKECKSEMTSTQNTEPILHIEIERKYAGLINARLYPSRSCNTAQKGDNRSLLTVFHYSQFSYRRSIIQGESQYYTFENNHLSTSYIFAELDNLGSGGDPDLNIQKPYGGPASWSASAVGPDSLTVYSTDSQLTGGMTGTYTVRVYGFTGGYTYEIRITVACTDTSGGCFCPLGKYPNPSTSSCSTCPFGSSLCQAAENSGCVQLTVGTATVAGAFNCYTCNPAVYTCTCHKTCNTCQGIKNTDCVDCRTGASLSGASPNTCQCTSAYFPNPDASICTACHIYCLTCSTATSTGCMSCKANASLASGSCTCNPSYYGPPSSCQICHSTCLLCSSGGTSGCTSCKSNASLTLGTCSCVIGYYPNSTSANCSLCFATCLGCLAAGSSGCSTCKADAHVTGTPTGSCVCNDGFYPNTTSANCAVCDSTCKLCVGGTTDKCSMCLANAHLIGAVNPGTCACDDGYFPDSTPHQCTKCHITCAKCTSALPSACTDCFLHANFKGGVSPDECVCDDGFYPDTDASNCMVCDISCKLCVGATASHCTACKLNATIEAKASMGKCICDSGFFPNPTAGSCAPCHPTCKECSAGTTNDCMECKNFAKLAASSPAACLCTLEAFAFPDASNCRVCWPECGSCREDGPAKCQSCKPGASLLAAAPSQCLCKAGFFPAPDASLCTPCNAVCSKCASEVECVSCKAHAILKDNTCWCEDGYYGNPDASNCVICAEGCAVCALTGCIKCKATWFFFIESCVSVCPEGYKSSSSLTCESVDLHPPIPSLTVTSDNTLSVFFDKPMNCTIESSGINIDIKTPSDLDVSFTWGNPQFQGSQTLMISLIFESDYLPAGSQAALTFLNPQSIIDEYNIAIELNFLQGPLFAFGNTKTNTTGVLVITAAAQTTAAASRGGVSAGAASSLLNGNPACLMSLVNQLQLISYISMTKLPLPQDFSSTLAALNIGQMVPNPLPDFFPKLPTNDTSQQPPDHVSNYGIGTLLFLPNSLTFLGTIIVVIMSFIPIYLLSQVKIKFIAEYFKKMLPSLKWNVPLQLWLTSFLDMGVFSLLQISNARNSFQNAFTGFNFLLGCFTCLLFIATPLFLLAFTLRNFNLISSRSDPTFNRRWGSLFLPFKSDYTFASIAYYILFVIRRAVLALSLVLLSDSLVLLAIFLYIVVCRPFAARIDQIDSLSVEGSTLLVYLTASSFLLDLSQTVKDHLATAGMWIVRAAIFSNVGVSITRTVLNVNGLIKAYRERMKAVRQKYEIREPRKASREAHTSGLGISSHKAQSAE